MGYYLIYWIVVITVDIIIEMLVGGLLRQLKIMLSILMIHRYGNNKLK